MGLFDRLRRKAQGESIPDVEASAPSDEAADPSAPEQVNQRLFRALLAYGMSNDEGVVDHLKSLFADAIPHISVDDRAHMVASLAELAEQGKSSLNPLNAFIFGDPSQLVVATATLNKCDATLAKYRSSPRSRGS